MRAEHNGEPPRVSSASFTVLDDRTAARVAHRVRWLLTGWRLLPLAAPAAELVDLLVLAAMPDGDGRADVRLDLRDDVLRAEVTGGRPDVRVCIALAASTEHWGFDAGGTVWFELPAPRPAPRESGPPTQGRQRGLPLPALPPRALRARPAVPVTLLTAIPPPRRG
jgi:hypothetical protein